MLYILLQKFAFKMRVSFKIVYARDTYRFRWKRKTDCDRESHRDYISLRAMNCVRTKNGRAEL